MNLAELNSIAKKMVHDGKGLLAAEDFRNDLKDAGEIGAGHHVTALYELTPPDKVAGEVGNGCGRIGHAPG